MQPQLGIWKRFIRSLLGASTLTVHATPTLNGTVVECDDGYISANTSLRVAGKRYFFLTNTKESHSLHTHGLNEQQTP